MFRSVAMALVLFALPLNAEAQTDVHRVVQGETLWALARQYYDAPTRWLEIYEANRGIVEDPHWIYPGEELVIPGVTTQTASRPVRPEPAPAAPPPAPVVVTATSPTVEPPANLRADSVRVPVAPATQAANRPVTTPDTADHRPAPAPAAPAHAPSAEPAPDVTVRPDTRAAPPPAPSPVPERDSRPVHATLAVDDYGVLPGDEIETTFYTAGGDVLASAAGTRLVDREGNLFFPFVGTVHVEGLDAGEIRDLLLERFGQYYRNPVVTVNVKLKVNITGVVGAPGHYLLDPSATIVDALAGAGGTGLEFTIANNAAADLEAVRLVRDGQTNFLDLRPEAATAATLDIRMQSGDWIHVPPKARSRMRDDITFWGGVVSLFTSVVAAVVLVSR
jgi:protein involved in polysaccharide export with SLBB domain/phage tail protein X